MSIIAIKGIPNRWTMKEFVRLIVKKINGPFEPLNFVPIRGKKTCYIRLSETLDPVRIVEQINMPPHVKNSKLYAFIPDRVPDLSLASKKNKFPRNYLRKLNLELEQPHTVIVVTHQEILSELLYKYPGLYNLSLKTKHKLLDEIAKVLADRLTHIMKSSSELCESCYKLSKAYRKTHPHFGDFQLILDTLHALQDASGAPRAQVNEADLSSQTLQPHMIEKIPYEKVVQVCNKLTPKIIEAVTNHINNLQVEVIEADDEQTIARKKVREEMQKLGPSMPGLLKALVAKHFTTAEEPLHKIRIYGEPFLPNREALSPIVERHVKGASRIMRSRKMYNLLMFKVPHKNLSALRTMDGTVVSGAKLIIRTPVPIYTPKESLRSEMAIQFGGSAKDIQMAVDEDSEESAEEQ